ncbi:MAG TPA: helix-turn-helix domain-containing protein [Actinomycetes bacterium]|nr:helix-turn-helix domain-containing protein [Actinomycetes bacterium]
MGQTALRADARRNRDLLLEAAAQAFAENGVDTSLEDIARRAGVGIGTLYRHFPTREALVIATYERGVSLLCDAAPALLAEYPDKADVALELWMERYVEYVATKRGLAATLKAAVESHDEMFAQVRQRIHGAADSLLDAAVSSGRIRPDVQGADLLRALGGICMVSDSDGWQEQSMRLIKLLVDGLRYGAPAYLD